MKSWSAARPVASSNARPGSNPKRTLQSVTPEAPPVHDIEFRRGTYGLPWDPEKQVETVEVVIDGVPLSERFEAAGSSGIAILVGDITADLAMWGPDSLDESPAAEGFVPVLTCGCTIYGCGGSYGRISFDADVVEWSDFHNQGTDEPVSIGPFVFDRQQYERARGVFAAGD